MKSIQINRDPLLSPRDQEYLQRLVEGTTSDEELAKELGTTAQVVKNRLSAMRVRMGDETGSYPQGKLGLINSLFKRGTLKVE